jgi:hypothetical protein
MRLEVDVVAFEGMSFAKQALQFVITRILIAPPGAALVNLVLLPARSHWVEVPTNGNIKDPCYYHAHAVALGVQYHDLCDGECELFVKAANPDLQYQDIVISPANIERFRELLDSLELFRAAQHELSSIRSQSAET